MSRRDEQLITAAGLRLRVLDAHHWHILGGEFLVNFYPYAKKGPKIYVAGAESGFPGEINLAIAAAQGRYRVRMLAKPHPHPEPAASPESCVRVVRKPPLVIKQRFALPVVPRLSADLKATPEQQAVIQKLYREHREVGGRLGFESFSRALLARWALHAAWDEAEARDDPKFCPPADRSLS